MRENFLEFNKEMDEIFNLLKAEKLFNQEDQSLDKANELIQNFEITYGYTIPENVKSRFNCIKKQHEECRKIKDTISSENFRKNIFKGLTWGEECRINKTSYMAGFIEITMEKYTRGYTYMTGPVCHYEQAKSEYRIVKFDLQLQALTEDETDRIEKSERYISNGLKEIDIQLSDEKMEYQKANYLIGNVEIRYPKISFENQFKLCGLKDKSKQQEKDMQHLRDEMKNEFKKSIEEIKKLSDKEDKTREMMGKKFNEQRQLIIDKSKEQTKDSKRHKEELTEKLKKLIQSQTQGFGEIKQSTTLIQKKQDQGVKELSGKIGEVKREATVIQRKQDQGVRELTNKIGAVKQETVAIQKKQDQGVRELTSKISEVKHETTVIQRKQDQGVKELTTKISEVKHETSVIQQKQDQGVKELTTKIGEVKQETMVIQQKQDQGVKDLTNKIGEIKHETIVIQQKQDQGVKDLTNKIGEIKHETSVIQQKQDQGVKELTTKIGEVKKETTVIQQKQDQGVKELTNKIAEVKHETIVIQQKQDQGVRDLTNKIGEVKKETTVIQQKQDQGIRILSDKIRAVKEDTTGLKIGQEKIQHEVGDIKQDTTTLKIGQEKIQHEVGDIKQDTTTLISGQEKIQHDVEDIKQDTTTLKIGQEKIQHDIGDIKQDTTTLKSGQEKIQVGVENVNLEAHDIKISQGEIKHNFDNIQSIGGIYRGINKEDKYKESELKQENVKEYDSLLEELFNEIDNSIKNRKDNIDYIYETHNSEIQELKENFDSISHKENRKNLEFVFNNTIKVYEWIKSNFKKRKEGNEILLEKAQKDCLTSLQTDDLKEIDSENIRMDDEDITRINTYFDTYIKSTIVDLMKKSQILSKEEEWLKSEVNKHSCVDRLEDVPGISSGMIENAFDNMIGFRKKYETKMAQKNVASALNYLTMGINYIRKFLNLTKKISIPIKILLNYFIEKRAALLFKKEANKLIEKLNDFTITETSYMKYHTLILEARVYFYEAEKLDSEAILKWKEDREDLSKNLFEEAKKQYQSALQKYQSAQQNKNDYHRSDEMIKSIKSHIQRIEKFQRENFNLVSSSFQNTNVPLHSNPHTLTNQRQQIKKLDMTTIERQESYVKNNTFLEI